MEVNVEKRIIRMSAFAREVLDRGKMGYVHSVYRKTINICIDRQLISLQMKGTPLSPLSIILDAGELDSAFDKIQAGDKVRILRHGILISGIEIYKENTEIASLKITDGMMEASKDVLLDRKALLYEGILELLKEKEVLDLFILKGRAVCRTEIALYAEKIIHEFKNALKNEENEKAAERIICLVGLGKGLTPSGDDFLCGMLAGLTYCSKERKAVELLCVLKKHIGEAAKRTNDISGAFLKCAVDGYYSEAIIKLPTLDNGGKIACLFSEIGHSSGADTLCGVFFAVETMQSIIGNGS